jgi:hypothetical protein
MISHVFLKFLLTLKYLITLIITTKYSCVILNPLYFAIQTSAITTFELVFLVTGVTEVMIAWTRNYPYVYWYIANWTKLHHFVLSLWVKLI